MKFRIDCAILVSVSLMGADQAFGGINGPYTVDATTAYLFHLDAASGASVSTAAVPPVPVTIPPTPPIAPDPTKSLIAFDGTNSRNSESTPYVALTSILGGTSSLGFKKCAEFSPLNAISQHGLMVDASGSGLLANRGADAQIPFTSFCDSAGSFTVEALISLPALGGNLNRTIVSTDTDTGNRGFSFRVANNNLLFDFLQSAGTSVSVPIPTTGDDAFVANQWYHVAVVHYVAPAPALPVTTLYWTKVDSSRTQANAIGNGTSEALGLAVTCPIVIGNEVRGGSGEGLRGKIDEVRISKGVRAATDFIFGTNGTDTDGDTLPDLWELNYFPDLSHDGTGDSETPVPDGVTDKQEYLSGGDPTDTDTDDDGLADGAEFTGSSNAYNGVPTRLNDADSDRDGITDLQENGSLNGKFGNAPTNPNSADTDGDGYNDYPEIIYGTNPANFASAPMLITLISDTVRNGSFELLGPEPGLPNAAKATHWDTDPDGDVTYWTNWQAESTAESDTGTQVGAAGTVTHGVKQATVQNGNAVFNMTDHIVQAGDIIFFGFSHTAGGAAVRGSLIYDAGVSATPRYRRFDNLAATEIANTVIGGTKSIYYTVPVGNSAIGFPLGVGFKSTSDWPKLDSVKLSVPAADADHDGLLDDWEDQYFGNNDGIATPAEIALYDGDDQAPDNDGYDNLAEQAAGSDPTNPASTPSDRDADGLDDNWEFDYFDGLGALPGDDPDGDHDTNLAEYNNMTSPIDKGDFFSSTFDTVPDSWKAFYGIGAQSGTDDLDEGLGDGSSNTEEYYANTSPVDRDCDDDGLLDGAEALALTNPFDPDSDDDGLLDGAEVNTHGTNPLAADTDGDTFGDKYEVDHGTSPTDALVFPAQPTGFTLVENFEGAGMTTGQSFSGVNGWFSGAPTGTLVELNPAGGTNKVGHVNRAEPLRKSLSALGLQIKEGNTGTLFFQIYTGVNTLDHSIGLTDVPGSLAFGDFEAQMVLNPGDFRLRDGAALSRDTGSDVALSQWMNVWIVANNATDTVKAYVETPSGKVGIVEISEDTTGLDPYNFRNGTAAALVEFMMVENSALTTLPVYIDNIYVDPSAANLANPLSASNPDSDGDGMVDAWEITYGLSVGTNDAAMDLDKDGTSNGAEFRLGLIPNSGSSFFKASANASTHQVSWQGVAGLPFIIQRSPDLAPGSWTTVGTVTGVDGTNTWTDLSPLAGKAFYKVILNP